ncbi:hypothetical protein QJS10_CPB19g01213 [Acorus calamus]|uniref:Uncharacterized protein n=1 Tax=Acorus calamus TaxID=4465 RepID=A0AAV9CFL9_ACOCL|nr:hypothetical protein QJS10_CPB19g01213 [Acorus calamus]
MEWGSVGRRGIGSGGGRGEEVTGGGEAGIRGNNKIQVYDYDTESRAQNHAYLLTETKPICVIPSQLVQLNKLSTFRVAYNDLTGIIPSSGQFSTFNESNFEGNPNLCGPMVGRNCSSETSQTHRIMMMRSTSRGSSIAR